MDNAHAPDEEQATADLAAKANPPANPGGPEQNRRGTRKRKDKNQIHITRHGALSRCPLQALALRGVNTRQLRQTERSLRAELKPAGTIGAMIFDRTWNAHLRSLLVAQSSISAWRFGPGAGLF